MKRPFIEAFSGSHHNGSAVLDDPRYHRQRADDEGYTLDWVKDASVELVAGTATALAHGFWSVLGQFHHIFVANVLDQEQVEPKRVKLESDDEQGGRRKDAKKHPVESFLPKHNYTRTPTRSQLHPIMGNNLSKLEGAGSTNETTTRPKFPIFELETRQINQPHNLLKAAVNNRIAPAVEPAAATDKQKLADEQPGTLTPMLRKARISYSPDVTPSFKSKMSQGALIKTGNSSVPSGAYGTLFDLKKSTKPDIASTKSWAHKFIESHNGTYQRPVIRDSHSEPMAQNEQRRAPFGLLGSKRRPSLYGDIHNDRMKLEKRREEEARLRSRQSDEEQFPSGVELSERRKVYDQLVIRHRKVLEDVRVLKEQKDVKPRDSPFAPLSIIQVKEVEQYWRQPKQSQRIVVTAFRIEISLADLQTLKDREWLNDNIIDYYLSMVTLRSADKSFSFSTHFFTTLQQKGHQGVARWAKKKKIDVRKLDYVFVPINRSNTHWCLAVVNNVEKKFQFYDSMGGVGKPALSLLREYMVSECERLDPGQHDKYRALYDSYKLCDKLDCPQQHNGSDCGVFTCKMVEVLSRNKSFAFAQKDMPGIRRKMAYEILHQKLI